VSAVSSGETRQGLETGRIEDFEDR
jgi:hypothetical protein